MILDIFQNGFSVQTIVSLCVRVFVIFCILPIHEFAHAYASHKLGDETAKLSGRLTVSPLAHIDPFGAILMIVAGVGWAKPVPVNMYNLKTKNKKLGMAIVSFAGPFSNILMALFFLFIMNAVGVLMPYSNLTQTIYTFVYIAASLNVRLAIFNLIPIPPLDGSRLITLIIPDKYYYQIMKYERYIGYAFMLLVLVGTLDAPLNYLSDFVFDGLNAIARFPFMFFA